MMHMQQNSTVISVRQSGQMCVCVTRHCSQQSAMHSASTTAMLIQQLREDVALTNHCP